METINGQTPSTTGSVVLKGGSVVTVKGYITKNGSKQGDFKGLLTATVRDTKELITCKKQEDTSASAFQYTIDRKCSTMVQTVSRMVSLHSPSPYHVTSTMQQEQA